MVTEVKTTPKCEPAPGDNIALKCDDGQFYVGEENLAEVNGVHISSEVSARIDVYFDGDEHPESSRSYVSFDQKDGRILMTCRPGDRMSVFFTPGNRYLPVDKDGEVVHVELDHNVVATVKDREDIGQGPEMTIGFRPGTEGRVKTSVGYMSYSFQNNGLFNAKRCLGGMNRKSVPLNIRTNGSANGTRQIHINDNNEYVIADSAGSENAYECLSCGTEIHRESERVKQTVRSRAQQLFDAAGLHIQILETPYSFDPQLLLEEIRKLPARVRESIEKIKVTENFPEEGHDGNRGCANDLDGRTFWVRPREIGNGSDTIYHEASHLLIRMQIDEDRVNEFKDDLANASGILESNPRPSRRKHNAALLRRWSALAGDIYGKEVQGEGLHLKWSGGGLGPKNGCVSPYGCTNIFEDIATFASKTRDPSFFRPLITPGSPQYDPRYRQKLDLLLEYGFITREVYDSIVDN